MIEIAINIAALCLMGLAGWNAGRPSARTGVNLSLQPDRPKWAPKAISLAVIGWCVAFLVGHGFDLLGLLIMAWVALGASLGPGNAVGSAITGEKPAVMKTEFNPGPERWQQGPGKFLLKSAWLSVAALGFLWGMFLVAVHWWLPLAFVLGLPLALFIALVIYDGPIKRVDDTDPKWQHNTDVSNKIWAAYNTLRAPISGLLLLGLLQL